MESRLRARLSHFPPLRFRNMAHTEPYRLAHADFEIYQEAIELVLKVSSLILAGDMYQTQIRGSVLVFQSLEHLEGRYLVLLKSWIY